jgi:LmeA-like phospholipid-binding
MYLGAFVVGFLLLLVVLGQIFLPTLAARRVRDRVARYGTVRSVSVSAFPAVKLLWGKADKVDVSAGSLSVQLSQIATLLWEAREADSMSISAETVTLTAVPELPEGLTVNNLRMQKHGSAISATATLTQQQLNQALPSGFHVEPTASGGGQVEARASGGLFGVQASITALVKPLEGRLVAEPRGFPLAALGTVTLFSDSRLKVGSIGVRVLRAKPLTYGLSLVATLV